MNQLTETVATIFTAIIGVAILAVLVSRKSNTSGVISAGFGGLSTALNAATSPVTGAAPFGGNMGFGGNSGLNLGFNQ